MGSIMMLNAIERILLVSEHIGIMGFFVDAKDEKARMFYEQFEFIQMADNPLGLFLPISTLRNEYEDTVGFEDHAPENG